MGTRYILFLILFGFLVACQSNQLTRIDFPEVHTINLTSSATSALVESTISGLLENSLVDQSGHVLFNQSVSDPKFDHPAILEIDQQGPLGNGSFTSTFENLSPERSYYARAFVEKDRLVWSEEEIAFVTGALSVIMQIDTFCADRNAGSATVSSTFTFSNIPDKIQLKSYGVTWSTTTEPNLQTDLFTPQQGREVRNEVITFDSEIFPYNGINYLRPFLVVAEDTLYGPEQQFSSTNFWNRTADFIGSPSENAVAFGLNGKGYLVIPSAGNNFYSFDPEQEGPDGEIGTWTKMPHDLPGGNRSDAVAFTINGKGYVGLGNFQSDFYEFDPAQPNQAWKEMEEFPLGTRAGAVAFSLVRSDTTFGIVGLGSGQVEFLEFYPEGDPDGDGRPGIWRSIADYPGDPGSTNSPGRSHSVAFALHNKGYAGLGIGGDGGWHQNTFYEFNPLSGPVDAAGKPLGEWRQVADYGPGFRRHAVAFAIGDKGYVGTGQPTGSTSDQKDLWEFAPLAGPLDNTGQPLGTWTQMANLGGLPRIRATAFAVNGKGFIGLGNALLEFQKDFWMYTPTLTENEALEITECE